MTPNGFAALWVLFGGSVGFIFGAPAIGIAVTTGVIIAMIVLYEYTRGA